MTMKKIYFGLIKLFQTSVSLFLVLVYNHKGVAKRVRLLKKDRNGRAVSLIANGPSAKEIVDSRKDILKDTDIIVLNYFGETKEFFIIKPLYYILLDPGFFIQDFKHPGLNENKDNNGNNENKRNQGLIEKLLQVDWQMTLFVPSVYKVPEIKKIFASNPHVNVIPYYGTHVLGYDGFQNFMYKQAQGVPSSRNVIIPAMLLMITAGYKTIFLYGCELSWTKTMDVDPENGRMFFNDRHFYSKNEIRYFGKGAYRWWLEVIAEDLMATEQIEKYAQKNGVRIINRTKGSFIDAFEYENPDTIKNEVDKIKE